MNKEFFNSKIISDKILSFFKNITLYLSTSEEQLLNNFIRSKIRIIYKYISKKIKINEKYQLLFKQIGGKEKINFLEINNNRNRKNNIIQISTFFNNLLKSFSDGKNIKFIYNESNNKNKIIYIYFKILVNIYENNDTNQNNNIRELKNLKKDFYNNFFIIKLEELDINKIINIFDKITDNNSISIYLKIMSEIFKRKIIKDNYINKKIYFIIIIFGLFSIEKSLKYTEKYDFLFNLFLFILQLSNIIL